MDKQDRELGMDADITRRDFLDGVAFVAAATAASTLRPQSASAAATSPAAAVGADYPPMRQGMRGFNQDAIDAGHSVRDGKVFDAPADTGEVYDLVVVGAGMAGLSAAYFYRKQIPNAKVLIIDGCDEFGGHARRNEFNVNGRQLLANGGTAWIQYHNTYPAEGKELFRDIGIDADRWIRMADAEPNPLRDLGLRPAMYFSKENFGVDQFVPNYPGTGPGSGLPPLGGQGPVAAPATQTWQEFLAKAPFSEGAKAGFTKLNETKDHMPGLSVEEKIRQLKKMSYVDFLTKVVNIHPDAIAYIQAQGGGGSSNQAAGPDTFSAWYAYRRGADGFNGMGLPLAHQVSNIVKDQGRRIVFPDGIGGVARLLVRWLIPDALPGTTLDDSVVPHVNYAVLDRPTNDVRLRLNSTAFRVRHLGDPVAAKEVEVSYVREGRPYRVRGGAVVMACFNAIVPYLVPELPDAQKAALHMAVRKPLVATNVALRNWRAFQKLGASTINCPNMFFTQIGLSQKFSMGGYRNPANPDEPIIVTMNLSNAILEKHGSGLPPREQWKAARAELQAIPFETFERNIRSQLDRILGPAGFSSRRDIAGIMVNRWGHAYATGSNELFDPDWSHRTDAPWVVGRQRFGRITISNSDSGAISLTQAAFMQSHRAVNEILTNIVRPVYDFHFSERDTAGEPGDYPNNF